MSDGSLLDCKVGSLISALSVQGVDTGGAPLWESPRKARRYLTQSHF